MSCSCSSEEPQARNSKRTGHAEQEGGKGQDRRFDRRRKGARERGEVRKEGVWVRVTEIMQMYETQTMENKIITLLFQAPRYFIFLHLLEVSQALLHVWACFFISMRFISP